MKCSNFSNFRSYSEMNDIYQKLYTQGKVDDPYLVNISRANQTMTFFGARHFNDVADPQIAAIETQWKRFIGHNNRSKIAFCEGGIPPPIGKTKNDAIRLYSGLGLMTWLANRDGIAVVSPEPDETREIDHLYEQGFATSQIMTYYFARQMLEWIRRDHIKAPDWKTYNTHFIDDYNRLHDWRNESLTLGTVLHMYGQVSGKSFKVKDAQAFYDLSNPSSSPVSAASNLFRDGSILESVSAAWRSGKDVFAVYGSGHAIVLENALKSLA